MSEGAQATLTAEGDCDCGNVDEVGEFDARAHTSGRFTLLETHGPPSDVSQAVVRGANKCSPGL